MSGRGAANPDGRTPSAIWGIHAKLTQAGVNMARKLESRDGSRGWFDKIVALWDTRVGFLVGVFTLSGFIGWMVWTPLTAYVSDARASYELRMRLEAHTREMDHRMTANEQADSKRDETLRNSIVTLQKMSELQAVTMLRLDHAEKERDRIFQKIWGVGPLDSEIAPESFGAIREELAEDIARSGG